MRSLEITGFISDGILYKECVCTLAISEAEITIFAIPKYHFGLSARLRANGKYKMFAFNPCSRTGKRSTVWNRRRSLTRLRHTPNAAQSALPLRWVTIRGTEATSRGGAEGVTTRRTAEVESHAFEVSRGRHGLTSNTRQSHRPSTVDCVAVHQACDSR
jgi:hypothetical protein